jgi:hypothetical protein
MSLRNNIMYLMFFLSYLKKKQHNNWISSKFEGNECVAYPPASFFLGTKEFVRNKFLARTTEKYKIRLGGSMR